MKKSCLFLLVIAFLFSSASVYAAETAPLGENHAALKVDHISFTDSGLKDIDVKSGIYVGLEGYSSIGSNFYLGFEVGYAYADGDAEILGEDFDTKLYYIPIELNFKYVLKASRYFVFDFGGGPSYNYAKEEIKTLGETESQDDWMFGGQFFIDCNYTVGQIFIGINSKYQFTANNRDTDHKYNNWRIGGQLGVTF
jgi:hypothetical protein